MTEAALLAELNLALWHIGYPENCLQPWETACSLGRLNINDVATNSTSLKRTSDFERRRLYDVAVANYFLLR